MSFFAVLSSTAVRRAGAFVPTQMAAVSKRLTYAPYSAPFVARGDLTPRFMSAVVEATEEVVEELPTNENDDQLLRIRHSAAHVMAMAVQQIFPEAQVTIGPWIENGFYYDFYFPETIDPNTGETIASRKLTESDLKQIKKAMDKICSKNYPIKREEVSRKEAEHRIKEIGEPFKLEILERLEEPITLYHIGDEWWDLCAGPHVESTGMIPKKAVALQHVAGAYWRGDENREMLQRIYATAWKDPNQLKQYTKMMEEAKKRDHRMLGQKLNLFSIQVRVCLSTTPLCLFFECVASPNIDFFLLDCAGGCRWRTCLLASKRICRSPSD